MNKVVIPNIDGKYRHEIACPNCNVKQSALFRGSVSHLNSYTEMETECFKCGEIFVIQVEYINCATFTPILRRE
jgi:hypothetical protein